VIKKGQYSAIRKFNSIEIDGVTVNFFSLNIPAKPNVNLPKNLIYSKTSGKGLNIFINNSAEKLLQEKFNTERKLSLLLKSLAKHEKVETIDGLSHFDAMIEQTKIDGYSEIVDAISSIQDTDQYINPLQAEVTKPTKGYLTLIYKKGERTSKAILGLVNLDIYTAEVNKAVNLTRIFNFQRLFLKHFNKIVEKFVKALLSMGNEVNLVELFESVTTEKDKENLLSYKLSGGKIVKTTDEEKSIYNDLITMLGTKIYEKIGDDALGVEQDKLDKALYAVKDHIIRCLNEPSLKQAYEMLLMMVENVEEGKWAESAVFSVIEMMEKRTEKMVKPSKMKDGINEAINILKSVAWELLCRHEYKHPLIRDFIKNEMKQKLTLL
jgi:hypothetical protein